MSTVKIKAIKDIFSEKGPIVVQKGREVDAAPEYAEKWVKDGSAEYVKVKKAFNPIKLIQDKKIEDGNN